MLKAIRSREDLQGWAAAEDLYQAWLASKKGKPYPSWKCVGLQNLACVLPWVMLIEYGSKEGENPNEPYVHYLGSDIAKSLPFDSTGKRVQDGPGGDVYAHQMRKAIDTGVSFIITDEPAAFLNRAYRNFDMLGLPLSRGETEKPDGVLLLVKWGEMPTDP